MWGTKISDLRNKGDWFNEFDWKLLQSPKLINKIDKCPIKVGHVVIWYFTDWSVKYTWTPLRNSGSTRSFDLKFWALLFYIFVAKIRRLMSPSREKLVTNKRTNEHGTSGPLGRSKNQTKFSLFCAKYIKNQILSLFH